MINIDFDNIIDEFVYEAFGVEGSEADALNDSYLELCLYRPEFIADLAIQDSEAFSHTLCILYLTIEKISRNYRKID